MAAVPNVLVGAYDQWVSAGRPPAVSSSWRPERWEAAGVPVPANLLSDPITRDAATDFASRVRGGDQQSEQDAFVVSMIWGHGLTGYGPVRVRKIISQPAFADQLTEVTEETLQRGGVSAYALVRRRRSERRPGAPVYLAGLGAAFGTKYIYFLTRAHDPGRVCPVLDAVAIAWFKENAPEVNVDVGNGWGYPSRYGAYVDTLHEWGTSLGIPADEVEHLLFAQQQSSTRGVWAEDWSARTYADPSATLEHLNRQLAELNLEAEAAPHLGALRALLRDRETD